MAQIPLENGGFAVCDDCDEPLLSRHKWRWVQPERAHTKYAVTQIGNTPIYMHRLVIGACGKGMVADHIDSDGLNNRNANLRVCHYMQNVAHSRKIKSGKSRFKGIHPSGARWQTKIVRAGQLLHIGTFATEEEAARAYDAKVVELDGPYAMTNARMGLYQD